MSVGSEFTPHAKMFENRLDLRRHRLADTYQAGSGRIDQPDAQPWRKIGKRDCGRASGRSRAGDQDIEAGQFSSPFTAYHEATTPAGWIGAGPPPFGGL